MKLFVVSLLFFYTISIIPNNKISIIGTYGNLIEYEKNQQLLFVISNEINADDFKYFELLKGDKIYSQNTKCIKKNHLYLYVINCTLDLSNLSFGKYKLQSFYYKNAKYDSNKTIEIFENNFNIISDITLESFSGNIKEYQESQNFGLYFSDRIQTPSRLKRMKIINEKSKKFNINLACNQEEHSYIGIKCISDFPLKVGNYQIINLLYYNSNGVYEIINPSENITFLINEDVLTLKRVAGEPHNEKFNLLELIFKEECYSKYFSKFFLRNVNSNEDYNLDYKFVDINKDRSVKSILFDLSEIPIGEYYVNFEYKRHIHINDATINIEEVKKDEYQYDDE